MSSSDSLGTPLKFIVDTALCESLTNSKMENGPIQLQLLPIGHFEDALQRPPFIKPVTQSKLQKALQRPNMHIIASRSPTGKYQLRFGIQLLSFIHQNAHPRINVVTYDEDWQPNEDSDNLDILTDTLYALLKHAALNTLEQARAYRFLMTYCTQTQESIASELKCSRTQISNIQRLLELPDSILQDLSDGSLSSSHCRTLLSIKNDPKAMLYYAQLAKTNGISVHALGKIIRNHQRETETTPLLQALTEENLNIFIEQNGHSGKIILSYESTEELHKLLLRLRS